MSKYESPESQVKEGTQNATDDTNTGSDTLDIADGAGDGATGEQSAATADQSGDANGGTGSDAAKADTATAATPAPAPTPAVAPAPAAKAVQPAAPVAPAAPAFVADALPLVTTPTADVFSPLGKGYLEDLENYISVMHLRRPTTSAEGAVQQRRLFRLLTQIVNNLTDDFADVWTALLKRAYEERLGAFAPQAVFRFFDSPLLNLSAADATGFRGMLNLIVKTADPKSRKLVLSQVNLEQTLNVKPFSSDGRERLFAFYSI